MTAPLARSNEARLRATATTAPCEAGVIVPLYIYPGAAWTTLKTIRTNNPLEPIDAVANVANGPGTTSDPNYVRGIAQLQSVGIKVLGYAFTSYGSRSASNVKADIQKWRTWYKVNGIFLDQMASVHGQETYYAGLTQYVRSLGMTTTVGNPGTDTVPSYVGTVDTIVIYESAGYPSLRFLDGWHDNYPSSNWAFISYSVASLNSSLICGAAKHVGLMYVTNDGLPNPYDTLPPYLNQLVGLL